MMLLDIIVAVGVLELFFCGLELNRIANALIHRNVEVWK